MNYGISILGCSTRIGMHHQPRMPSIYLSMLTVGPLCVGLLRVAALTLRPYPTGASPSQGAQLPKLPTEVLRLGASC